MSYLPAEEVKSMISGYTNWLRDRTILKQITDEWVEVTTPTLDRHNDMLQIYICRDGNDFLLSDDGYVVSDLELSGCALNSSNRKALFNMTIMSFGIQMEGNCLVTRATKDSFPLKKHNLLQAMSAVNDMFYLSPPHTISLFYDSVTEWMDECDIRYVPRVKFTGKSGYDNMFDFVIPKSKYKPMRLMQLANIPSKDKIKALMFKWIDAKDGVGDGVKSYVILNDEDAAASRSAFDAITSYDATPVVWSEREKFIKELAA